jgi:hypothetical protein
LDKPQENTLVQVGHFIVAPLDYSSPWFKDWVEENDYVFGSSDQSESDEHDDMQPLQDSPTSPPPGSEYDESEDDEISPQDLARSENNDARSDAGLTHILYLEDEPDIKPALFGEDNGASIFACLHDDILNHDFTDALNAVGDAGSHKIEGIGNDAEFPDIPIECLLSPNVNGSTTSGSAQNDSVTDPAVLLQPSTPVTQGDQPMTNQPKVPENPQSSSSIPTPVQNPTPAAAITSTDRSQAASTALVESEESEEDLYDHAEEEERLRGLLRDAQARNNRSIPSAIANQPPAAQDDHDMEYVALIDQESASSSPPKESLKIKLNIPSCAVKKALSPQPEPQSTLIQPATDVPCDMKGTIAESQTGSQTTVVQQARDAPCDMHGSIIQSQPEPRQIIVQQAIDNPSEMVDNVAQAPAIVPAEIQVAPPTESQAAFPLVCP